MKNETPNSTELLKKQFWHPGFSFLKFKEKIYQIRKEVMLFLRNCDQSTVFLWMDGVEEEEEIDDVQMKMEDRKLLFLDNLTRLLGQGIQLSYDLYYY